MKGVIRAATVLLACVWAAWAAAGEGRKVLILYSYSSFMPWQTGIHAGLAARLDEIAPAERPDIYEEQVDGTRVGASTAAAALPPYLRAKYGAVPFDAVIAESPAATQILLANPDLFRGAERYTIDPSSEPPARAGGFKIIHPQGDWAERAFDTIVGVVPKVRRVIAVADRSISGALGRSKLLAAASSLPPGVALEVWDDFTFDELLDRSAALGPGDVLYYTPTFTDRAGAHRIPRDVALALAARSAAPVFAGFEQFLGGGIVGGRLLSPERVGRLLADLALGAERLDRWPEVEARLNRYTFDGEALRRWNIAADRLPQGSTVVEPEGSAFQRYRRQIAGALGVLVLQGCLIVWLVTALRQRKAAVAAVVRERDGLEAKVAERTEALALTAARLETSNRHLRELADTDPLTGVANRRRFMTLLDEAWPAPDGGEARAALLMLDIDHFKSVNDRHGHELGDAVIRAVAEVCCAEAGPACVGRLGGEEFAVVAPSGAEDLAERIRAGVGRLRFAGADGDRFGVTVSVGIGARAGPGEGPTELLSRADAALYRAKRAGRDRVVRGADAPAPPLLDVA